MHRLGDVGARTSSYFFKRLLLYEEEERNIMSCVVSLLGRNGDPIANATQPKLNPSLMASSGIPS